MSRTREPEAEITKVEERWLFLFQTGLLEY